MPKMTSNRNSSLNFAANCSKLSKPTMYHKVVFFFFEVFIHGKTASTTKAVLQLCPVNNIQNDYKTAHAHEKQAKKNKTATRKWVLKIR